MRPGRFDRTITFDIPSKNGRREIIDYYLGRKSHDAELDREDRRDAIASMTMGYTPVMIEHLFDKALVWALRDGRVSMDWHDVNQAKLTEEIGIGMPVDYTFDEQRTIATHESGHAVVAYLAGVGRKLDVLSIVKRGPALGLLAHSDIEERFTNTRSELYQRMQISFGGLVAEQIFIGEHGTGPGADLEAATKIAATMVGSLGMGDSLVSFAAVNSPIDLVGRVLGDEAARADVERLLNQAQSDVEAMLTDNRHLVEALRSALLVRKELIGDEIIEVLEHASHDPDALRCAAELATSAESDSEIDIRDRDVNPCRTQVPRQTLP